MFAKVCAPATTTYTYDSEEQRRRAHEMVAGIAVTTVSTEAVAIPQRDSIHLDPEKIAKAQADAQWITSTVFGK